MDPITPTTKTDRFHRVMKLYQAKHKSFGSGHGLATWYDAKMKEQNNCCYYCSTPIELIQRLIAAKLLATRKTGGGGYRGGHLEIDKQGSDYSPETCVLACYYCNNDKSYIFSQADYKTFMGPAKHAYFQHLARQLK